MAAEVGYDADGGSLGVGVGPDGFGIVFFDQNGCGAGIIVSLALQREEAERKLIIERHPLTGWLLRVRLQTRFAICSATGRLHHRHGDPYRRRLHNALIPFADTRRWTSFAFSDATNARTMRARAFSRHRALEIRDLSHDARLKGGTLACLFIRRMAEHSPRELA